MCGSESRDDDNAVNHLDGECRLLEAVGCVCAGNVLTATAFPLQGTRSVCLTNGSRGFSVLLM